MCGGGEPTNGLDTGKGLVRTFIYMNRTTTPNRRLHHLISIFAVIVGRSAVPMRSLATKFLAVTAIVVAGATALAPAAHAWSSNDAAVAIVVAGRDWGNMRDVAVADDGSLFACGHFRGSTDLDPDLANVVTVNPGGLNKPGLVVKLNTHGNYVWHATVDTPDGSINSCVVANDGSVYATGFFRTNASVVASDVHTSGLASDQDNLFVAKFSPDGANVRIEAQPTEHSTDAGLWTISGNIITNQTHNLLLRNCRGVTVTGNTFGTAAERTILIERCRNLVIGSNNMDFNPDYKGPRIDGVLVKDSMGINLHGLILEASLAGNKKSGGAIGVFNSHDLTVANCQIIDPTYRALHLENVTHAVISSNLVRDHGRVPTMQEAVLVTGGGNLEFPGNLLDKGRRGKMTKAQ